MSNIQRYQQPGLVATNVAELEQLGKMCAASGFFQDSREAAQAMVKIAAGQELGLPPIMSMTSINVIKGRVTLSANLMAALLKRAGYRLKVAWEGNTACTITVWDQQGNECGDSTFSLDDAKQAGLGGDNWKKFPRNMLYARAVSNAARWYAPEVLTGCYLPDELDGADEQQSRPVVVPEPIRVNSKAQLERVIDPDPASEPVEAVEIQEPDTDRHRRHFFAVASEMGLSEDEQRAILGVDSRKDATPERYRNAAQALQEMGQTECEMVFACLEAPTIGEMRDLFRSLPEVTREFLKPACQHRARVLEAA